MNSFCFETLIAADQIQPEDQFPFEFSETYLKQLNEKVNSSEAPSKFLVAASEISEYGLYDNPEGEVESLMDFKVIMHDDEFYKCNKELLKAESNYFKSYFEVPGNETSTELKIANIPYEIMLPILDYIHYGTLYLKPRNVYKILVASNFLSIVSICKACIEFYTSHQKRDYSKDTEDVVGYSETRSCSPYCINDFYHVSCIILEYNGFIDSTVKPFILNNFDILINPVFAKYYNEEFVSKFIFNPEIKSKIPNYNVYAAFFFEWLVEQKKLDYTVAPDTITKFAKSISWRDVSQHIRNAAGSERLKSIIPDSLAKSIETGDLQTSLANHEVRKEFRFWNCELVIPESITTIDFMLPGHRDAISELFHVLLCFPNLQTIKPRERFCKQYSSDTGSCSPESDFWYPDQWEEFFDNLDKYQSKTLQTIDFKGSFFYHDWNYSRQHTFQSNNSHVKIELNAN